MNKEITIKECCTLFTDGDWIESKDQSDSGIRLIQTGNIGNGLYLEKKERAKYISEETMYRLGCTEIYPGDILVSRLPDPVGRACMIPPKNERMITAVDCSILRINDEVVDKRYLLCFLNSPYYFKQITSYLAGTTRTRISRKNLERIIVKLPVREKQLEIAKQIGLLTSIINLQIKTLDKLDELIKSRFVEMFGDPILNPKEWKMASIGDIVTEVRYGTSRPSVANGKFPYLRMNNLTYDGHLDLSELKRIDVPDDEIERCIVRKGDVLFNRTNSIELVGKTCVFNESEDMIIAGYIIRVRLKQIMNPIVFSCFMNTDALKNNLRNMAKGAVNQANINAQELQAIRIYLPPLDLQSQFADFVTQVEKQKATVQQSIDKLETLKKSLMQEYFE